MRETIRDQIPADYPWPGNVRELEQCIRRIVLKQSYEVHTAETGSGHMSEQFVSDIMNGALDAQQVLSGYCRILYDKHGTYGAVASLTGLDRRTVKKYVASWDKTQ